MKPEIAIDIARRPFKLERELEADGTYHGSVIQLPGNVKVSVAERGITATIADVTNWERRAVAALPKGAFFEPRDLFRIGGPGKLIRREHYGTIETDAGWRATDVLNTGCNTPLSKTRNDYFFSVTTLHVGDTTRVPAALRSIYRRGAFSGANDFCDHHIIAHELVKDDNFEREMMAITFDWNANELERDAVWHAANLVVGQTLQHVATEAYGEDGSLLLTQYRIGANRDDGHRQFFHLIFPDFGKLAPNGWGTISEGVLRLLRNSFPIEVVLHHLHEASVAPYDIEAQHLVLAIHTAIEAWNRFCGRETWIDDKPWDKIQKKLRTPMKALPEYLALSDTMQANIRSVMAHANRTTTAWRQEELFAALEIDVSDADSQRALGLRNQLLHNGYFLKRWRTLTHEERQTRLDDIERLRRLTLLIVLKLTRYTGDYCSPVKCFKEHVDSTTLKLPNAIVGNPA